MKKFFLIITIGILLLLSSFSCSSVFSAGVSGKIVDAESTESPKSGIQDVEIYAYTSEERRDSDFSSWTVGNRFSPTDSEYFIGHTTTNSDGSFTINKIVWEEFFPNFGKTADYCTIYLLFYHENYGLVKNVNPAIIMSDTTANVVYQEMTKTRKSTTLAISIIDVGTENIISDVLQVNVIVPDNSSTKTYTQTITGSGNILISYPRFTSTNTENFPAVKINVKQNGTTIKWQQSFFDKETSKYNFFNSSDFYSVTVKGNTMQTDVYVKSTILTCPAIKGQVNLTIGDATNIGTTADDNLHVFLAKGNTLPETFFIEPSNGVTTKPDGNGSNNSTIIHGVFSNLANTVTWKDVAYTEKYSVLNAWIVIDKDLNGEVSSGDIYSPITLRSDISTFDIGIFNSTSIY